MVPSANIRPATPEDGAQIMRVHMASILRLGRSHYSEAETESWAAGLKPDGYGAAMAAGGESFDVAIDKDERIVGFCSRSGSEICALYVDPEYAGQGIGGELLQRAEAEIVRDGHETLLVRASCNGQRFYEKHGYRVVGREKWKTRGGLEIDRLEMRKTVP